MNFIYIPFYLLALEYLYIKGSSSKFSSIYSLNYDSSFITISIDTIFFKVTVFLLTTDGKYFNLIEVLDATINELLDELVKCFPSVLLYFSGGTKRFFYD